MTARTRLYQARSGGSRGFGANDAVVAEVCHDDAVVERCCTMRRLRGGFTTRFVLAVTIGCALFFAATAACADDLQQYELGKTRFDAGEYDKAAERFAAMLDPTLPTCEAAPADVTSACQLTDPDVIERARTFRAASLVALDRMDEADAQIELILRKNFQFSPDPAALPQKLVDRFTVMRGQLRQEIEAERAKQAEQENAQRLAAERAKKADERWLADVLRAASEERVVVKNSRYIAALPFGVGQFQNGKRNLGTGMAISQSILAFTSVVSSQAYTYFNGYYFTDHNNPARAKMWERRLADSGQYVSILVNQISFGAFVAVAIVGIVQAQVAFVPENVTVRKRAVPPRPTTLPLRVTPTLGMSSNTVSVGLSGVF